MSRIVERIKVPLSSDEYAGLVQLAETELRPVDEQIRWMLRRALRRRGLLLPPGAGVRE